MCNVRDINNPLKSKIHSWIMNKFNGIQVFTSGLNSGYLGSGVAIIMNISLAKHMCKVSEVPAGDINSMIAKTINESSFVILNGDFNEDGSYKCASFKKCLDLGLVNSLSGCFHVKMPMCINSRDVAKMINFLFIFSNLINAMAGQKVFNTVSMSVGLDEFVVAVRFSDLNVMWDVVCKILVFSANEVFKKRKFLRYHKLERLVSKIVKTSCEENVVNFDSLMKCWVFLNNVKALVIQDVVDSSISSGHVCSALCGVRKTYRTFKLAESLRAKKATIKAAIDKRIESFKINKSHTIRSVLKHPFCKVVFDHLVVDNKLILEPNLVKSKVNIIMEGWTRKHYVVDNVSGDWFFSNVMCSIEFNELFEVIFFLPNGKAAGLSGILNELWKHCDRTVLDMLLVFLNSCLSGEFVSACKILSKILSDRISLACSTFDILCGNNFLSSIFAIGLVIENALEKNQKLWMVLQDMRKTYDSVGWEHLEKNLVRIKIYSKFIHFFNGIHKGRTNYIMTDFGLSDGVIHKKKTDIENSRPMKK
ncbi:hypothetical protein G9A89_023187 [Geosiphon pyriformis]|nr:hypothetical protein G9A89_023187 [Geosiphon pyriformis]